MVLNLSVLQPLVEAGTTKRMSWRAAAVIAAIQPSADMQHFGCMDHIELTMLDQLSVLNKHKSLK